MHQGDTVIGVRWVSDGCQNLMGVRIVTAQAVFLQKENHRFPDRNEDAAAERHFQDFHRHHHLNTDHRYRHGGLGFAKNVELRALVGSFDDFVVNE